MSREVDTAEYMGMLRELIGQGHRVSVRVAGNSMSPFLKHGRDTVFFAAPDSEIKRATSCSIRARTASISCTACAA